MNVWSEDQIGLRALKDVNLPKFTVNDIPLYIGITADLFPGIDPPRKRDMEFEEVITKVAEESGMYPDPELQGIVSWQLNLY